MNLRPRALAGHPWVFANEVESLLPAEHDGEVVACRDRNNRLIGSGIYNSKSQILWRRLSRDQVELDVGYLRRKVEAALARRAPQRSNPSDMSYVGRLIWSESDDLPGVVVDQFGDTLVVQIQTAALEKRTAELAAVLAELVRPAEIIFRNDAPIRRLEGLPLEVHTQSGRPWEPRWLTIDGFDYWLDLQNGQKTGFYLDQRPQHPAVARYAAGKRVLDAFCNQGAFALHAARAGAAEVLGLDSSEDAIASARRNAERNQVKAGFAVANVFDWFNDPARNNEPLWDVIVLDPPPFAKSKSALEGAARLQGNQPSCPAAARARRRARHLHLLVPHAGCGAARRPGRSRHGCETEIARDRMVSPAGGPSGADDDAGERVSARVYRRRGVRPAGPRRPISATSPTPGEPSLSPRAACGGDPSPPSSWPG